MNKGSDHERLMLYAEGYFQRHQKAEWPTVRRCADSLRWTHGRVEDAADGDPDRRLSLTYYRTEQEPERGDRFVEVDFP